MKKQSILVLLVAITAVGMLACRFVNAKASETLADGVTWERLLSKNDFPDLSEAAFSLSGERFLLSDGYSFLELWEKPFIKPTRRIPTKVYNKIENLEFYGGIDDIFISNSSGLVQIWDKNLKNKKFEYQYPDGINEAAITSDGCFVAADGWLYDRRKKKMVGRAVAHASQVAACFGGGSLLLTAGYHDHGVAVRNIHSGEFEYRRTPHPVRGAGISHNEKYVVAVTNKGRCYLWNWPEKEPLSLAIARDPRSYFVGFSPDSKWFVVDGTEFMHIFQTNPPMLIARLKPDTPCTCVVIASNNLIAMGDENGDVHIYDVAAGKVIAKRKVCEHSIDFLEFSADKGYLWAASNDYKAGGKRHWDHEIALYRIKGLEPYIDPHGAEKMDMKEK
jgi:WD40 repeat protein